MCWARQWIMLRTNSGWHPLPKLYLLHQLTSLRCIPICYSCHLVMELSSIHKHNPSVTLCFYDMSAGQSSYSAIRIQRASAAAESLSQPDDSCMRFISTSTCSVLRRVWQQACHLYLAPICFPLVVPVRHWLRMAPSSWRCDRCMR